jgi:hypothetical protein
MWLGILPAWKLPDYLRNFICSGIGKIDETGNQEANLRLPSFAAG